MISRHKTKIFGRIALAAATLLILSCTKKGDCCKVVIMNVDLDVRNKSNQSVFDKSLPGYLTPDSIRVFYLNNGKYQLAKNADYDADNGFLFFSSDNQPTEYTLRVMVSSFTDSNNESFTLVKYGNLKTDTLKTKVSNNVIQRTWINGKEISISAKPLIRVIN